ncbi:MAG: branched-chain amino acid ABC transporter permease [Armatimonadota bacterium]|nr:branched-chain amino acid ABC transporter permease [Armatimonadota bacterium]MDR7403589.1 branched-chain amino acid ABC transporter permease [Armatimonadota bacterium]
MELRERYEDDLALVRGGWGWAGVLAGLGALAVLPAVLPGYAVYTASLVAVHAVVALGLNLLVGYTGQISLGQAGFVAVGAYATVLLTVRAHLPWPLALAAGGAAAAAFGVLVGVPALRLSGPYLTVATLGFGIAVHQVLTNWEGLSGGRTGLFVPPLSLGPRQLTSTDLYYLSAGVAVLLTWMAYNLTRSHVGRAWMAIRDSDIAAEAMGVDLPIYKTLAFAVCALYAGIGGGLLALLLGYLEPQLFTLYDSIYYFSMIVVGGLGTIPGSALGAALLTVLPRQLAGLRAWLPVLYGGVVVLVMAVEPLGLYGRWLRIRRWWSTWPL